MATRSACSISSFFDDYETQSESDYFVDSVSETCYSVQTGLDTGDVTDSNPTSIGPGTFVTSLIDTDTPPSTPPTIWNPLSIRNQELHSPQLILDSRFEDSPLACAIFNHDESLVRKLLGSVQFEKNETFHQGRTALHLACMLGHKEIVRLLLKAGWSADANSKLLRTPLHEATIAGHYELFSLLVEKESKELNAKDKYGFTATHLAALHGETHCLVELVQMDCDTSLEDNCGRLASHLAASRGHLDTLKAMSENGFDIDGEDFEGRLPAHYAAGAGSLECLQFMSSHGIDLVSADSNGWEPIHQAAAADQLDCLMFFTTHGTKVSDKDKRGRNVAHISALNASVRCLHWILERGDNPNLRDNNTTNNSLAHLAALIGSSECVNCIMVHNADMSATNMQCLTPFQVAKNNGKVIKWKKGLSGEISCIYCQKKKKENITKEKNKNTGIRAEIESATGGLFSGNELSDMISNGKLRLGKPRMPQGHQVSARKRDSNYKFSIKRDMAAIFYGPEF